MDAVAADDGLIHGGQENGNKKTRR